MPDVRHLVVDSRDPFERGRARGSFGVQGLRSTWPIYEELFAVTARLAGRPPVDVASAVTPYLDATSAWAPDLLREMEGVAEGSGLGLERIAAVNARTEILALARGCGPTECSTVVQLAGRQGTAVSAQTWDWHADLASGWHVQTVRGDERTFVGLTEYGMLAKIGLNDAGLGVHFNLLRHASDAPDGGSAGREEGGVPVHLLARRVLGTASTVAEAAEILTAVRSAGSSVITVVTPTEAASVEVSPAGTAVLRPEGEWLLHTNHFLDPVLARGERVTLDATTTFERLEVLRARAKAAREPMGAEDLVRLLAAHEEDGAALCRHPDPAAPFGYRTATLATVTFDPAARSAAVSPGGPCRRTDVTKLSPLP
jgi:isopenicillin-N N-acyltransferase like protein